MATDFIRVAHPDIDGTASVSPDYFDMELQAKGWRPVTDEHTGLPPKNASVDVWRDYAKAAGMPAERAAEMSRDQLIAIYTSPQPAPDPATEPQTTLQPAPEPLQES